MTDLKLQVFWKVVRLEKLGKRVVFSCQLLKLDFESVVQALHCKAPK